MKQISNEDYRTIMQGLRHLDYKDGMTLREENAVRKARQVYKKLSRRG